VSFMGITFKMAIQHKLNFEHIPRIQLSQG